MSYVGLGSTVEVSCKGGWKQTADKTWFCETEFTDVTPPGEEPRVDSCDGRCIDTNTESCSGVLQSGLCPGPANIKCCSVKTTVSLPPSEGLGSWLLGTVLLVGAAWFLFDRKR